MKLKLALIFIKCNIEFIIAMAERGIIMVGSKAWRALAGSIAVGLLSACNDVQATSQDSVPPPKVEVEAVTSQRVRNWDEFNGRIVAIEAVAIQPRVSGYIQQIAFDEGGEVKEGDLLFVIDPRPYRDAVASAEADLKRAEAATQLALLRAKRSRSLVDKNVVSRDAADSADAELAQKRADVDEARARLSTARLNLEFTEIRAPVAGRVSRAFLSIGNLAQADQTRLTTIVSQNPVYVYFDLDEKSYLRYKEDFGQPGQSRNPVVVGLADQDAFPFQGALEFIDNQIDPGTGTIRARAKISNPQNLLIPGLYARVRLGDINENPALLVSDRSILTDQNRKYVYAVDANNKAIRKDIVTGRLIGDRRIVDSGLDIGDRIVVTGTQKILYPGMEVSADDLIQQQASSEVAIKEAGE